MIVRKERTGNFFIVPNDVVNDSRLSLEARGLLCYLLSKPDSWEVQCQDIQKSGNIGRGKAYSLLRELIDAGYVDRSEVARGTGKYTVKYTVFDHSHLCRNQSPVTKSGTGSCDEIRHAYKDSIDSKNLVAKATSSNAPMDLFSEEKAHDPKQVLFNEVLSEVMSYTGWGVHKVRPLFGRWLKAVNGDAELLAEVLRAAIEHQPGDFVSFVGGTIRHKTSEKKEASAWMDVWK